MVEGVMTCSQLADQSLKLFMPMLDQWRKLEHPDPSLVGEIGHNSAAAVLEKDLRALGIYLISRDDRSTRIELGALVDCIAALRSPGSPQNADINADKLAEEFQIARHNNAGSSFTPPPTSISLPLSLRVARDLKHHQKPANAVALKQILVEFLHRLVLRDGNVTTQEITVVDEMEEFLASLIDTTA